VQRAGLRYACLKLILFGSIKIRQVLGLYPTVTSICGKYGVLHILVGSLNLPQTIDSIQDLGPDVLLSILFEKIFPIEILHIPRIAALNFHPAPLPRYAGIAPTFWVLSRGEKETAVSIHYLDEGIDTGEIFSQKSISISQNESVHSLYLKCCDIGSTLLLDAISEIIGENLPRSMQAGDQRTYFSAPTREGYRHLRKKHHSLFHLREIIFPR
jgi:methionyl-tRNA formyltransferase